MFVNEKFPNLMKLEIKPYAASPSRPVKVIALVGENRLEFDFETSALDTIEIPIKCSSDQDQCKVELIIENVTSPKNMGQSSDARLLGVALYAFSFKE